MNLLLSLRLSADVCFWGALVMLYKPFKALGGFVALCAGLAFLGVGISTLLKNRRALRIIPLFLPLAAMLFFTGTVQWVLAGLICLYLVFMSGNGDGMSYWRFRMLYCFSGWLSLLFITLVLVIESQWNWLCSLALIYVFVNGYVLRQLRFGVSDRKAKRLDILSLLVILIGLGIIGVLAYGFSQNDFSFLSVLLWPFAWVLRKIAELLSKLTPAPPEHTPPEEPPILEAEPLEMLPEPEYTITQPEPLEDIPWDILLTVLGAALALFLLYRLLRWMKDSMVPQEEQAVLSLETEPLETEESRRPREDGENTKKIRKVYREYLRFLRIRGMFFPEGRTSRDVQETAQASIYGNRAEDIRESYIRVRYGEHVPDGRQVKDARKWLREAKQPMKQP